jgi:predicted ATPase
MIRTLAISGYRSLRKLTLPLGRLTLVTGANGSGKSNLYRALRLLSDAALNAVVASLAREGGLPSTLWAGPEVIGDAVKRGDRSVEPTVKTKPISLKLGFAAEPYSYSIDLGYPPPGLSMFGLDPEIKRECIWHGDVYRRSAALVDRQHNLVTLPNGKSEPVFLTQNLGSGESILHHR